MKPTGNQARAAALVFDFDGTILDTETPVYESWAAAYRWAGAEPVPRERWLQDLGKADGYGLDVRALLCEQLGVAEMPAEAEAHRKATRDEMLFNEPLRDGVTDWLEAAAAAAIPLAVASSSSSAWVIPHLERLGLHRYFAAVSCADPGIPGKPDPTVYLSACDELDVDPATALAIEDSTHGVSAAIAAGMRCIATPGPMTKTMDFSHSTVRADSLALLDPADWF